MPKFKNGDRVRAKSHLVSGFAFTGTDLTVSEASIYPDMVLVYSDGGTTHYVPEGMLKLVEKPTPAQQVIEDWYDLHPTIKPFLNDIDIATLYAVIEAAIES